MKNIFSLFVTIFLIITVLFFLLRALPGGPFDEEQPLSPEIKLQIEKKYGLHQPLVIQYLSYLKNVLSGDLGESYRQQERKISEIIIETFPTTLNLGILTLIFSYGLGIFLGVVSLDKRYTWLQPSIQFFANAGSCMPAFLAGPLLIIVFSFWLDWLPPALWESPKYYILPVLTLSLRPLSLIIRLIRVSGLENIQTDFVRMAQAKGVSETTILFKHVLKNSLIPILSISGGIFAQILSGSFIVEEIFAVPGVARYFIESVGNRDYSLVVGLAIVYSILLILFNLFFDFIMGFVDPRIKNHA